LSLFVDASALTAIMTKERDHLALERLFGADEDRLYSAVATWETARALATIRSVSIDEAQAEIAQFAEDFSMRLVSIGAQEAQLAIAAHDRYGKGRHPAKLNMGDCFAYACAKANGATLLYTGDDFARADLA
jgi:ribonuclease VapC